MDNKPKILAIDIETTPLEAYSWGPKWETSLIEVTEYTKILSFSAKWVDGKQVTKGWLDYKKCSIHNDKPIVEEIWKLLDEADIITGHNVRQFDVKIMNSRFLYHGMTPPSPYRIVDTKTEAKKYIRMPSYKLDDLCDYFKIGRKVHHEGFPLWVACMAKDKKATAKMLEYNRTDTLLQEQLYLKLRPFMRNHPNFGMYTDKVVCPNCGSGKVQSRGNYTLKNNTTEYKRAQCQGCGAWMVVGPNLKVMRPAKGA